jgi:parallel beta-helix repeat protein
MTSKICDFGIAKVFKKNLDLGGIAGTEGWMAPEVYQSDMTYPTKIDVYSYGIVLYEIITHEIPYATILEPAQIMQLTLSGQRPIIANEEQIRASDTIMNELITLFYSCTELDPQKRPSFSDITKILFFPIPGRVEYKVDQNAEKDIQTFNKIQQVIDCVCDEVLHTPLERKGSLTKIVSPPPQKISKTLPTMMDGQFRIIVPATRSLRPPLVHVSPGTYIENLTLVKNLEIKAEGKVIIEPQDREKPVVTMKNCGGATFRNCIFPSGNVLVTGVDSRSHFKDCQFENVQVQICDKSDPFITRCMFQNCEITISDLETRSTLFKNDITGRIVIANGARTVLQECTIHDAERGIEIGSQCRTYVEQCEITKCKSGIFIGKGGDPMIEYCKIYGNGIGIETDEEAIGLLRKNQVSGNEVDFKIADSATTWNEDLLFQTGTTSDDDEDW